MNRCAPVTVCLCCAAAVQGLSFAQEISPPPADKEVSVQQKATAEPTAAELTLLIRQKRAQLKAVETDIRTLHRDQRAEQEALLSKNRAEKQEKIEALRLTDPQQYERVSAEKFKEEVRREFVRRQQADESSVRPRMTHAEWVDSMKAENPAMHDLIVKQDTLAAEIKALRRLRSIAAKKK